jgi:surfactin synthase thioesterase subunit
MDINPTPLICLPFAGAGSSVFSEWSQYAPGQLEIIPLQLPGREKRFAEPLYRTIPEAVVGLFPETLERLDGRSTAMFFGHSMGAVLAYELVRKLVAEGGISVAQLFVSGSHAPGVRRPQQATGLSDTEFLARVSDFAGYRHTALEEEEMRDLLLPILRADVEMHENYEPSSDFPVAAPITSIRGRADHLVSRDEMDQWRFATSESFQSIEIPGGHMYLIDHPDLLVGAMAKIAFAMQELPAR